MSTNENSDDSNEDMTANAASPDAAGAGGPVGQRWLKYAGVGGGRQTGASGERLHGEGITSLGSLEAEILGLLWEIGRPATGMEVMEHSLYRRRGRGEEPASFATISTTLRRLTQKGLLLMEKNGQRTPVYAPTVAREAMAARVLNNVSQTLLGQSLHALLPKLVGSLAPARQGRGTRRDGPGGPLDGAVQRLVEAIEEAAADERAAQGRESGGSDT